jgi:hypothetical protein
MIYYTGTWRNGKTHTVTAPNGDDAWRQLLRWADANNIQFPTQFTMFRRKV